MSRVRVLLVDDSPQFLASATQLLRADPRVNIVGCAMSGTDALQQLVRLQPDLVLMDISMTGMNGLETTRRVKVQAPHTRVVMLTLHDNAEYRAAAADVGADGFVAKSDLFAHWPEILGRHVANSYVGTHARTRVGQKELPVQIDAHASVDDSSSTSLAQPLDEHCPRSSLVPSTLFTGDHDHGHRSIQVDPSLVCTTEIML